MKKKTIRVVTHEADGSLRTMEYDSFDTLDQTHEKVGIDDCSTDLSLRGMPVYRGLVGPIPESKAVVRYESPEVFEMMTKEWARQENQKTAPSFDECSGSIGDESRSCNDFYAN